MVIGDIVKIKGTDVKFTIISKDGYGNYNLIRFDEDQRPITIFDVNKNALELYEEK